LRSGSGIADVARPELGILGEEPLSRVCVQDHLPQACVVVGEDLDLWACGGEADDADARGAFVDVGSMGEDGEDIVESRIFTIRAQHFGNVIDESCGLHHPL